MKINAAIVPHISLFYNDGTIQIRNLNYQNLD